MQHVLCITDKLDDADAWTTHLDHRSYDVTSTTLAAMSSVQPSWTQCGLLLSHAAARQLAAEPAGFQNACRRLKADRIVVIGARSEKLATKCEFNGTTLQLKPSIANWRFSAEVGARFLSGDQSVAVGDPATQNLLRLARRVATSDVTVMLVGPTGTGKEVFSRFLHKASPRARNPFIAVNCAAVPDTMLEALLFGYERGAFTGAHHPNKGIFRAADTGTLLLDEISEMALPLQAKLLRVLQEKEVTPLGSSKPVAVDVRVVATSNRYMLDEVKAGRFREDLYYRLNVFPLVTKALAERPGDILPIAVAMLAKHAGGYAGIPEIGEAALERIESHDWPGNVRELENVLQRALVLSGGGEIRPEHLMLDAGALMEAAPAAMRELQPA